MSSYRSLARGVGGTDEDGDLYIGKALLDALCLTFWNLAVPITFVKHQSNNDVHGYVISECDLQTAIIGFEAVIAFIYISAWASALLVSINRRCQNLRTWDE